MEQLPKVELHLHLDCSLSYEVVTALDPSITEEAYRRSFIAPAKCNDLADFLTRTSDSIALMQTKQQLQMVVDDLFRQLAADQVLYAEIRFAPLQHLAKGLSSYEVVEAIEQATAAAIRSTGIEARLILCTLRHFDERQSMETVQLAEQFKGTTIAAFDIAGDEAGFPVDAHIEAFRYAHARNIFCTAHAGEARGAASVWETLEHFKPSRIGHGVRSIEDDRLVQHLRRQNIHLEVCPTSNVQINVYDTYHDHPINGLYNAGISLSVNTDTRTITDVTLGREYERLQKVFGWGIAHFFACNVNALKAAFIDDDLKSVLINKLAERYRALAPSLAFSL